MPRVISLLRQAIAAALPLLVVLSATAACPAFGAEPASVPAADATLPLVVATPVGLSLSAETSGRKIDSARTSFTLAAESDGTAKVATSVAIDDSELDVAELSELTLAIGHVDAPEHGDVAARLCDDSWWGIGEGRSATLRLDITRPSDLAWSFTVPGHYKVTITANATLAAADSKARTVAADPITYQFDVVTPPADPEPRSEPRDHTEKDAEPSAESPVKATARSRVTDAGEAAARSESDDAPDDSRWNVANWSATDSGATILNDGHIDIASTLDGGVFDTQVKDTTNEGQTHATYGGASWHDPAAVVLQLLPGSETAVPAGDAYSFLGSAGKPVWLVSETQQPDLLWPGWSTETIPAAATRTGVTWKLNKVSGPGEFALYKGGQILGSVDVLYNTRDGITSADAFEIAKNSHVHGSWAFSAEGTYCLASTRSTTLANGSTVSDDFTLAVAVGRVEVKKVDPSACFADSSRPDTQDTNPVPDPQLTSESSGGVQVLNSDAGFYPGQLMTVQVGTSHAGRWVSLWLNPTGSQATWLGWVQVGSTGIALVRLPADALPGSHKLVVKTAAGDLIGWAPLAAVQAPDSGDGGSTGGGNTGGSECTAGETTIISAGHLDYSTQVVNGKLESLVGDSSSGATVYREPSKTVLWLKPSSRTTLPAGYEQIGTAGSSVYMVPQTQNPDLIWLGWSTEKLNSTLVSSPVSWRLTSVDGPGSMKVFLQGEFGGVQSLVFTGAGSSEIRTGVHAHANWAFSAAGIYRLHFTQTATLNNGGVSSDSEVLTIVVGDVDPATAIAGGRSCVGNGSGGSDGSGAGSGSGSGSSDESSGGSTKKKDTSATQCTSNGVTVIPKGHLDWNARVINGKLESLIGDDSTGTRKYREPSSTVLWLKPAARVTLPSGLSRIGSAGTTVWQVPQTQDYNLIWLGWSTELLNAGNASSAVTWKLTRIDGPGWVKVYTVGSFGGVENLVFSGTGSYKINLGVHAHANWAFSKQGVYRLHFTETVKLKNGKRSTDSEVLTIAVGNANPRTALRTGAGCGAVSSTSDDPGAAARKAAEQSRASAAIGQSDEAPGGTGAAQTLDPVTAAAHGSLVPLLLNILGGLLLIGGCGTGVLWWRRRPA